MLAIYSVRLMGGLAHFGHGGFHHGHLFSLRLLIILLGVAGTIVLSAAATTGVSSWIARKYHNEHSTNVAGWVTFILVFAVLGWLTLRIA